MRLKHILSRITPLEIQGPADQEITGIAYDSRLVKEGFLFIAVEGEKADGRNFVPQAVAQGAAAVMSEAPAPLTAATRIVVANARSAMAAAAAAFYRNPSNFLKVAGVTGTNGKTTTVFLIKHICEQAMHRCGLLGTVRYEIGDRILPAQRTTPESLDVQNLLSQMHGAGCKAVAMEVSSHAAVQDRVKDVEFDAAVFTNLTQDHLDYHKTMEAYFEAKSNFFTSVAAQQRKRPKAVINIDDRYGGRLAMRLLKEMPVITFGVGNRADLRASNIRIDFSGTSYQLDVNEKSYLVRLPLIGRFNVYNSLAALGTAVALGIDVRAAVSSLAHAPSVPGRLEPVPAKRQFKVFVDYAHTHDALLNVIKALRELNPNRVIVVFGCGGDRDKAKRPLMASVVDENADYAFVTSDNPRKENPEAIIADILKGFRNRNYEVMADRKEAIYRAVAMARPRDIVLIAGKGHENYQEFADSTIPFDDATTAQAALANRPVEMQN